jgi:hypothetical protein
MLISTCRFTVQSLTDPCFFFLRSLPPSSPEPLLLLLGLLISSEEKGDCPPILLLATLLDCLPANPKHFSKCGAYLVDAIVF